jgi:hypothetical protein
MTWRVLSFFAAAALSIGAHAGPLNPPAGPITPSFKTLTEVEPRVAINAENTPGDATCVYRITRTGSYYLTGMLQGQPGKHGILIAANGVTIDLNGYDLVGNVGSSTGIRVAFAGLRDITVMNGSVRAWGGNGVDLAALEPKGSRVVGVRASGSDFTGIKVHSGVIESCTATGNDRDGIDLASGVVTSCQASENGQHGFELGYGVVATECMALENVSMGIHGNGAVTISSSVARQNGLHGILTSSGSVVRDCTSHSNEGHGIWTGGSANISNCHANDNAIHGILAGQYSLVLNNSAISNGTPGTQGAGAGFYIAGNSRVEGNHSSVNAMGFRISDPGTLVIRNSCANNTTDWVIDANNVVGPIIDRRAPASAAINGFAAPSSLGTMDPNANFSS